MAPQPDKRSTVLGSIVTGLFMLIAGVVGKVKKG